MSKLIPRWIAMELPKSTNKQTKNHDILQEHPQRASKLWLLGTSTCPASAAKCAAVSIRPSGADRSLDKSAIRTCLRHGVPHVESLQDVVDAVYYVYSRNCWVTSEWFVFEERFQLRTWWPGDWPAMAIAAYFARSPASQHLSPFLLQRCALLIFFASSFSHNDGFQDPLSTFSQSESSGHISHLVGGHYEDLRRIRLWFSRGTAPKSRRRRRTSQCPFIAACATTLGGTGRTGRIPEICEGQRYCYLNCYKTEEPLPLRYSDSASSLQPAWICITEFCTSAVPAWWTAEDPWGSQVSFGSILSSNNLCTWHTDEDVFATSSTKFFASPIFGHLVHYEAKFRHFGWKGWWNVII